MRHLYRASTQPFRSERLLGTASRRCNAPAAATAIQRERSTAVNAITKGALCQERYHDGQVRTIRRTERSSTVKTPKKASIGKVLRREGPLLVMVIATGRGKRINCGSSRTVLHGALGLGASLVADHWRQWLQWRQWL